MEIKFTKLFSKVVSLMLIAAVSLTLVSCTPTETPNTSSTSSEVSNAESTESEVSNVSDSTSSDGGSTVGEGDTEFAFTATLEDGTEKTYTVKTDKTTVGEALVDAGLISGTDGDFGLYVDTVCGEYHKWEDDGKYWAFYIDGEYAMTGVDATDIEAGKVYSLKAE